MTQLQNILDEMKGQKLPSYTSFGRSTRIKHKHLSADNPQILRTPISVKRFDELGERFTKYIGVMSTVMSVKDLLKELSNALAGKESNDPI